MRIVKSDYTNDLFFLGYDDNVTDETVSNYLRHHFDADFDGLDRRDCDSAGTNTENDYNSYADLSDSYDTVERVYLRQAQ